MIKRLLTILICVSIVMSTCLIGVMAAGVNAAPTASKVTVNGIVTSFEAYNINGNNYFKLRDIAKVLDGTNKKFNVTWDGNKNAINLITGAAYTVVGGELTSGDGKSKSALVSSSKIYKDGADISLSAYNINGNNYFKLRDIGKAFNFGVNWDEETGTIKIDTSLSYTEPDVLEPQELTINLFQEPNTLDFQACSSTTEVQIYNWAMEGLTRSDVAGSVKSGIAEKWEISPDGLVWTFHLRDAKWSDGKSVTANDFKYGWMRAIDPNTPMDYTYLLYDIKNAEAYSNGNASAGQVGIKVIDDKTLEVTLEHPVTYFDNLVSFATFAPVRQDVFEAQGDRYNAEANGFVCNGPFTIDSWQHESGMVFKKNPNYWDAASIKLEKVTGLMIADVETEINMYESGKLDNIISLDADQKAVLTKGSVQKYTDGAVFYFLFNCTDPVLKNVNIRKALTYAIDRQYFIDIGQKPWKPATAFVQPDVIPDADGKTPFRDKVPSYFKDNDVDQAKLLLAQGMRELGISEMPVLKFIIDSVGESQAQVFSAMWKENLGIDVTVEPIPLMDLYNKKHNQDFQITLAGWGPDYSDPMTYLDLWVTDGGNNTAAYSNPAYDKLIRDAKNETDKTKKFELMHQAEELLMNDMPVGPIYFRYKDYAVREYVKNFTAGAFGPAVNFVYSYIDGKAK